MTRSKIATTCAALMLSLFVWSARPAQAEAQSFSLCSDGCPALVGIAVAGGIVGGAAGGFVLGLGIADFVSYGIDSPWDDGWATVDIVLGSLLMLPGLGFLGTGFALAAQGNDASAAIGGGFAYLAWGGHLLAHGIWSLENNDRARPPVSVAASGDGVSVSVQGSF